MAVIVRPQNYPLGDQVTLNVEAIERIVAAVEESGRRKALAPGDIDRTKLAADLNATWRLYQDGKYAAGSIDKRNAAVKRMNDIAKHAAKLRHLLESDEDAGFPLWVFAIHFSDAPYQFLNETTQGLRELEEGALHMRDQGFSNKDYPHPLKSLLGYSLPEIYYMHFRREPGGGRSEDGSKVSSPYLRFACAVGREFGDTIQIETASAYLKHWKDQRKNI
jgi:hypothetical protein